MLHLKKYMDVVIPCIFFSTNTPLKYRLYIFKIKLNILDIYYKLFVTMFSLDGKLYTNYYFSRPKVIIMKEQVGVQIRSLDCIQEVSGSNLELDTIYPHESSLPQLIQASTKCSKVR